MEFIKRHKLLFIVILVQLIALPVLLYIVKQNQETRTQAIKATNLFITPTSSSNTPINVDVNDGFTVDVMLDPGVNLASIVKIDISYDPNVVELAPQAAVVPPQNINYDAFPVIVEGPVITPGRYRVVLSVGTDYTRVLQTTTRVLSLGFDTINTTNQTQIEFGSDNAVYSVADTDSSSENVLSSASPAYVNISAPATPTPIPDPSITVNPTTVDSGGNVAISVKHGPGFVEDWVAMYKLGDPPSQWISFQYLNGTTNPPQNALTEADLTFAMPQEEGQYMFRFLENDLDIVLAESETVTVGDGVPSASPTPTNIPTPTSTPIPTFTPTPTPIPNPTLVVNKTNVDAGEGVIVNVGSAPGTSIFDWIGLYKIGEPNTNNVNFQYLNGEQFPPDNPLTSADLTFTMPFDPGQYEFRYLENDGFNDIATSQPITVNAVPTTTPVPVTFLNFSSIKLHGLGSGGDNPNPNSLGTQNPLRPNRIFNVEIYNQTGSLITSIPGAIDYNGPNPGNFSGIVEVPSSVPAGLYNVKIKSPYYLKEQMPGFIDLILGTTNQASQIALTAGDVNNDNKLTPQDYEILIGCYSDLLPASDCDAQRKIDSDISDDGLVNHDDYNLFLRELSVQEGN